MCIFVRIPSGPGPLHPPPNGRIHATHPGVLHPRPRGRPRRLLPHTIEIPWATSFVAGLVPNETVETASKCPNGVARVETYHSFLNMLATVVTWNIYSPMTIEVTCAAGGMSGAGSPDADVIEISGDASLQLRMQAINYAAWRSDQLKHPVYVMYGD
ncbi:MAG: hypothetical protein P8Z36_09045 [Gemmatimonadota bacterium]